MIGKKKKKKKEKKKEEKKEPQSLILYRKIKVGKCRDKAFRKKHMRQSQGSRGRQRVPKLDVNSTKWIN